MNTYAITKPRFHHKQVNYATKPQDQILMVEPHFYNPVKSRAKDAQASLRRTWLPASMQDVGVLCFSTEAVEDKEEEGAL